MGNSFFQSELRSLVHTHTIVCLVEILHPIGREGARTLLFISNYDDVQAMRTIHYSNMKLS